MRITEEEGSKINFILWPTNTKAHWPTQRPSLFKKLTDEFQLDFRPPSAGIKILGVPFGSDSYVCDFFLEKFDDIDAAIALGPPQSPTVESRTTSVTPPRRRAASPTSSASLSPTTRRCFGTYGRQEIEMVRGDVRSTTLQRRTLSAKPTTGTCGPCPLLLGGNQHLRVCGKRHRLSRHSCRRKKAIPHH